MSEILRSIVGNQLGLDHQDNLLVKGNKVLVQHMSQEIDIALDSYPPSNITYDDSTPKRVLTYVKNGITFTCTYHSGGNGDGQLNTVTGGGFTLTHSYNSDGLLETVVRS